MPYFRKNIIKPYFSKKKGRGRKNRMNLVKELTAIKKMINAEKQNAESFSASSIPLAQYFTSGTTGAQVLNIMPTISQGVSEDQRKGDTIKVCSFCLKLAVENSGNDTVSDMRYKFYVVAQPTNPKSDSGTLSQFFEPSTFSGVEDYNSNRDYQHFKDYVVLGVINGRLAPNTNDSVTQVRTNNHTLARKREFHIRWVKGNATAINNNSIHLLAVCSDGDRSTSDQIFFRYSFKLYYYDN